MSRTIATVNGVPYDLDDLTLDEVVQIERTTGTPWTAINAWARATDCRAILIALYARTRPVDEATKVVGSLTSRAAVEHLSLRPDDDDDRPVEHRDGIPVVDPKAEPAETATT